MENNKKKYTLKEFMNDLINVWFIIVMASTSVAIGVVLAFVFLINTGILY